MTREHSIKRLKTFAVRATIDGFFCLYFIPLAIWVIYPETKLSVFLVFTIIYSFIGFIILNLPNVVRVVYSGCISSFGLHRLGDGRFEELCRSPIRWFIWDDLVSEAKALRAKAQICKTTLEHVEEFEQPVRNRR